MRSFLDTNMLVHAVDMDAGAKQITAQRLMEVEAAEGRLVLSTRVLHEFYVAVTRKLARPLPAGDAEAAVRELALHPTPFGSVPPPPPLSFRASPVSEAP